MIYKNEKTKNISFPLGGIGTGCIGLSGNGELVDWEIFNRPNKNTRNGYSHFAIKATLNGKSTVKVLHGDTNDCYIGRPNDSFGHGPNRMALAGYPHFRNLTFDGSFPIANITYTDDDFPAKVKLCAFNPFIPHDDFNSGIPAAFFEWEIENTADKPIEYALAYSVNNPSDSSINKKISSDSLSGIILKNASADKNDPSYSDLCILTDGADTVVQEYWYRGSWMDNITTYWKNLLDLDRMPQRTYSEPSKKDPGTVVSYVTIPAGKTAKLRFVISWNVPTAENYWKPRNDISTWKNYYSTQFKDSFASAKYALESFDKLYEKTAQFSDALQSCTLSESVKDAVVSNLSVLKSPTVLRLEDGTFWAWEGCNETTGSCFGTCQHVWNYAYAMPYLFPKLERSMREATLNYGYQDNGATSFRLNLPLRKQMDTERPCLDGQMGEVIKCYREWKLSGDDEWLKTYADRIFGMLEYAWSEDNPDHWDRDMDGVLEGRQHHTLDMELFGPSSWLQGFYLLALDCGAKIAKYLGDNARAELYTKLYKNGKKWTNENLFNGKYFCQKVDLTDRAVVDKFDASKSYWNDEAGEIKYQVADGCIIDQMLSDWHAVLIGTDGVFDSDKKKTALESLYKYNYKHSMREVTNMWRNFSLNDESGTIICSYPDGVKLPAIPISYIEETMTGFEYALAGLMISEGYLSEGETMVKAIRDRYDGEKRNPWNEIECGNNYARSMASFALMMIYCGFTFDMPNKHISFAPINPEGKYLYSVCDSWGMFEFDSNQYKLTVNENPLELNSISIPSANITKVTVDGKNVYFEIKDNKVILGGIRISKELILA